ncbi:MAG: DMT family transporter [Bacteroidales bacterium]|nr:DMT family transporter [Bacteroidales bacterium]
MRFKGNRIITGEAAAFVAALLVIIIWGETFVSSKVLLDNGMRPADIFFYRFLLAYICIWFFSPKKLFADSWKDEARMFLLGIFGGSMYFLTENTALSYSTASNVGILVSSAPLITAIAAAFFYKDERMNSRQVGGSLLAFVGMVMVVLNGKFILHLNTLGDSLALAAAICWTFYSLILKGTSERYSTVFITRKVFFYGLVTMIPYFLFISPLNPDPAILSHPQVYGNLIYLGLVASLICFLVWNKVVTVLGTVRTMNLIYTQPFFTMLFSYLILSERITWMAIAGALLISIGMFFAERKR